MTARSIHTVLVALIAGLMLTGCFQFRANLPGVVRTDLSADATEEVGTVDEAFTEWYLVHGLFGATDPDALKKRVLEVANAHGADGLEDVEVEATFTYVGIAITIATFSMIHPRQYRLRGKLVRIDAPAP